MSKTLLFPAQRGSLKHAEFQEIDKIKMSPQLTRGTRMRFLFPNSACDMSFILSVQALFTGSLGSTTLLIKVGDHFRKCSGFSELCWQLSTDYKGSPGD